jgi:hypothetical protein
MKSAFYEYQQMAWIVADISFVWWPHLWLFPGTGCLVQQPFAAGGN